MFERHEFPYCLKIVNNYLEHPIERYLLIKYCLYVNQEKQVLPKATVSFEFTIN